MPQTAAQAAGNIQVTLRAGFAGIPRDLDKSGIMLTNAMTVLLSQPGAGRVYTTHFFTDSRGRVIPYGIRRPHQASAPGDPPAVDTGRLRASYGHQSVRTPKGGDLEFGTGVEYAKWLEFGTSRMPARPHLRPVMARNRMRIREILADGIEDRERAMARRVS